jgi:hypothetical protein
MEKINILKALQDKNFVCYRKGKYSLDHDMFDPYYEDSTGFDLDKVFETENNGGNKILIRLKDHITFFKYFLDGSRYTYKIGDMETSDSRFMPIIAGQLAAGVCKRESKKISKHILSRVNILMLYNKINEEDYQSIKENV